MEYDVDHLTKKRSPRWKINFRAPIWTFILIFVVSFLFGSFVDEGYSDGMNNGCQVYQQPNSK